MKTFDVPYVHQIFDTPDAFNGGFACSPTSAVMALASFGKLFAHHIHVNLMNRDTDYGFYVSEVYTNAGTTFNHQRPDPVNRLAEGAYGWCVNADQEGEADLIVDYINKNGLPAKMYPSTPTFDAVKQVIDSGNLAIVGNFLTSVGHVILIIGYTDDGQIIAHDPFGNHKLPSYGHLPNGANVIYHWSDLNRVTFMIETLSPTPPLGSKPLPQVPGSLKPPVIIDRSDNIDKKLCDPNRSGMQVLLLVLHDTEGKDGTPDRNDLDLNLEDFQQREDDTIHYLQSGSIADGRIVSAHYLIGPEKIGAKIYRLCPENAVAYHAGGTAEKPSSWIAPNKTLFGGGKRINGTSEVNVISIGIERWGSHNETAVGPLQTQAMLELAVDIAHRYNLKPEQVMAHAGLNCGNTDGELLLAQVRQAIAGGTTS
jgi:hypothetical protein